MDITSLGTGKIADLNIPEDGAKESGITDMMEKNGKGEVLGTEPRLSWTTANEDCHPTEPVFVDHHQSSDLTTENLNLQGVSVTNGVPKPSGCQSASRMPFDETYIKANAEKGEGDLLFLDTRGSHKSASNETNSSHPIIVDLSGNECDIGDKSSNKQDYREQSDNSVSELSSFETDSEIEIEIEEIFRKGPHLNNHNSTTTRGELTLKDLPPIQDLKISVPEGDCLQVGIVTSIVYELVVIQSLPNIPALDLGTVLFLESGRQTLGEVFDVFGPVKEPYYAVRFNSANHARERGVKEGVEVFCAPKSKYTSYIFLYQMMKLKGSDASWKHNEEPPENCVDFSDDEEERTARKRNNTKEKKDDGSWANIQESRHSSEEENKSLLVESNSSTSYFPQTTESSSRESSHLLSFTSKSSSSSGTHWRDLLPEPLVPTTVISPSTGNLTNSTTGSALHPPGHPPLRSKGFQEWLNSESALKTARRVSRHLYRHHPLYQQVLEGTYPPPRVPAPTASQVSRTSTTQPPAEGPRMWTPTPLPNVQRPKICLLPRPETPHQRLPLLPSPMLSPVSSPVPTPLPAPLPSPVPNHWPFVMGPMNPFAPTPPNSSVRAPVHFQSTSYTPSFTRPPPIPPSQIRPRIGPNHPARHLLCPDLPATNRPVPLVPAQPPISSSPLCGLPYSPRLNVPPPPTSLFSSFGGPHERRNSVPPLPPPSLPPFNSPGQMRPFMLRPSSLFTTFPPNGGT